MDKLTIEEKAKRYDEVIERAVNIRTGKCETTFIFTEGLFDYLFPELEECNEEEVREAMIDFFKHEREEGVVVSHYGVNIERMIAWLEKQGEQKSDNKFETKFKVGDWVVVDGITQKVTHIQTEGFDTDRAWNGKSTFKDVHLWTIADVKDCDVLVDVYGNVGIYKSHDDFSWLSYCSLGYYGGFQHFTIEHDNEKTHPATKEQRDLLFQKMKEAGYKWDAEKKELKKISQRMISAEAKEAMYGKPTAWSEDDEAGLGDAMWAIEQARTIAKDENDMGNLWYAETWLKSLRLQKQWKPSEKQIMCLQDALSDYHRRGYKAETLETLLKQLKQL